MQDRMLQFFEYGHLPERLARVSLPFCELAQWIATALPANPERTVALRKLLEAKDCAVRAALYQEPGGDNRLTSHAVSALGGVGPADAEPA